MPIPLTKRKQDVLKTEYYKNYLNNRRLRQYTLRDLKGYYNHSALLNANTSQPPPITNVLLDKRPLQRRGRCA